MAVLVQLPPGSLFAERFRVVRPLGHGGMGTVYEVRHEATGALRALKLMLPQLADDASFVRRFEREARASAQIESDHVVQVLDAGVDVQTRMPWLAMELLKGESLASYVERKQGLSSAEMAEVFAQLGHALDAAHRVGIVHCDLKPENVFLARPRREGVPFTVKVLDFGIARMVAGSRTTATVLLGSPMWVAPEQTEEARPIDGRTDVWALGLLAFFALTGRSYWLRANADARSIAALMRELLFDPLAPASERARVLGRAGAISPGFDQWFSRCVAREPDERFATALEARAALLSLFGEPEASGDRPSSVEPPMHRSLPPPPVVAPPHPAPSSSPPSMPTTALAASMRPRYRGPLMAVAVLASGITGALLFGGRRSEAPAPAARSPEPRPAERVEGAAPATAQASSPPVAPAPSPPVVAAPSPQVASALPPQPVATGPARAGRSSLPPPVDRPASAEASGRGFLSLVCVPYCDSVVVRGRNLGPSPIVNEALSAGVYSASLIKKGMPSRQVAFTIKPGEATAVRVSLDQPRAPQCDPPYTVDSKGIRRVKPECRPL